MSWASRSRRSPVSAHHTDSDFGAENVASNPDTARTTRPSLREPVDELAAERCPRDWVAARQQRLQLLDRRLARQAEPVGLAARPHARHLARRRRQVLRVVRRRRRRRRRMEGRHPQHGPDVPTARGHLSALTWTTG